MPCWAHATVDQAADPAASRKEASFPARKAGTLGAGAVGSLVLSHHSESECFYDRFIGPLHQGAFPGAKHSKVEIGSHAT